MVRSVTLYISTHLAKFVSSARSNFLPRVHFARTSLFTLSILLHRMPGNLRPFVPFPFDRKVSSSWAGWTDGATRQRVNCLSGYSQRLARAHTHIYIYTRCVVRAIRCVTRGCIAYIGRHAIVAPSNVNKYRGRSFRILDTNNKGKVSRNVQQPPVFKTICVSFFPPPPLHFFSLLLFLSVDVSIRGLYYSFRPFVSLSRGQKAVKRNGVINTIMRCVRPADQ